MRETARPADHPDAADVQGLARTGYASLPAATYLLARIDDPVAARAWLADLASRVTAAEATRAGTAVARNVALTAGGLAALDPGGTAHRFSVPFVQGARARASRLGDVGANDPRGWAWGGPGDDVHLVLLLYAGGPDALRRLVRAERAAAVGALDVVHELATRHEDVAREAFGFRDGIGQPVQRWEADGRTWPSPPGHFVLGPGAAVPVPSLGEDPQWGCNGSYLVLRQLEQHVATFHDHLDALVEPAGPSRPDDEAEQRTVAAAKMVGRWPDGQPLTLRPTATSPFVPEHRWDDFTYDDDPDGLRCPLGAHVRRANPRRPGRGDGALTASERHRLLRRGRPYGRPPADGVARPHGAADQGSGLHFLGLCADLEQQFEFVQRTWFLSSSFNGLRDEIDPLVGPTDGRRFSVPGSPAARRRSVPPLVTTRGALYAFLPGVRALRALACPG